MHRVYPLNQEAWDEWVEYRTQEKRKKIGPMAERKQQKFLMQFAPPIQQTIIDESIMNSWQGLFEPKGGIKASVYEKNLERIQDHLSASDDPFAIEDKR